MQSSVMYGIMLTMLIKKKVTRRYLSEKYEVSERTISRYVDTLAESGVPIYTLAGANGGYCISEEFKLNNTMFTKEELLRLSTCLKAVPDDKLNMAILDKIGYMAERKNDEQYLVKTDRLIIDAGAWGSPTVFRHKMEVINSAIDSNLTLEIKYTDRYEMFSTRKFDPYSLVLKEGIWYTYGWCHRRQDFRLFKLARITSIITTDQTFEKRETNIYEHLSGKFDNNELIELEIEFSSTILGEIEEWLGIDAIHERGLQYVATASVYSGNMLIKKLLSFGSSIKVLSPAPVREELLVECKRILRDSGEE